MCQICGCVNDYGLTAAVNPSDGLGGMNTCDQHKAREQETSECAHKQSHYADTYKERLEKAFSMCHCRKIAAVNNSRKN